MDAILQKIPQKIQQGLEAHNELLKEKKSIEDKKTIENITINIPQKNKSLDKDVNIINGTELPSPSVSSPSSRSNSPSRKEGQISKQRRFMNGWTKEQEKLMADWSDICTVYKWCHQKAEQRYHTSGLTLNLIIIVISSLAGFSNIGVQSLFEGDQQAIKYASFAIGGISLVSSLLTTIGNTLKWIAQSESHRVSEIG
jgi:hypothetical protein